MEKTEKRESPGVQGNLSALATGKISRLLWDYSLPAVVGMLVMSLYNVIDRIFIGQGVGTEAIAGLAITFPVMNVSSAIGVLVGAGASARVSIFLGAKNRRGAELTLGNSLTLTTVNAAIYILCMAIWLDDILRAFGASDVSLPYAHDFMICILPGMFIMNVAFSFNNIMRASGYPMKAMWSMFVGAGVNLVLAPTFIFGFGWGIKGAAIATDIAMGVFALIVMTHFCNPASTLHFKRGVYRLKWKIVAGIVSIGAAPSVVNLAGSAINVIINKALYHYGSDNAVAAAGIFTTFTSLLVMVVVGICQGMQPIIGYNYGAGHLDRLRRTFWLAAGCSSMVCAIGAAGGLIFAPYVARAFTVDAGLIEVTGQAFRHALWAFWMVGFQIVATTFFQSIGKAAKSIFLSLTRQVIFLIPLMLWLPNVLGLNGVWTSFPISDTFATIVSALMVWWQFGKIAREEHFSPSVG